MFILRFSLFIAMILSLPKFAEASSQASPTYRFSQLDDGLKRNIRDLSAGGSYTNGETNLIFAKRTWDARYTSPNNTQSAFLAAAKKLLSAGIAADDLEIIWYGMKFYRELYFMSGSTGMLENLILISYQIERTIQADALSLAESEALLGEVSTTSEGKLMWLMKARKRVLGNKEAFELKIRIADRLFRIFSSNKMEEVAWKILREGFKIVDESPPYPAEPARDLVVSYATRLFEQKKYAECIEILIKQDSKLFNSDEEKRNPEYLESLRLRALSYEAQNKKNIASKFFEVAKLYYDQNRERQIRHRNFNNNTAFIPDTLLRKFIDSYISYEVRNGNYERALQALEIDKSFNLPDQKSLSAYRTYFKKIVELQNKNSNEMLLLAGKRAKEMDPTEIVKIDSRLREMAIEENASVEKFLSEESFPTTYRPRRTLASVPSDGHQASVTPNLAYLSIFISQEEVIGFVRHNGNLSTKKIPIPPETLENYANQLQAGLLIPSDNFYENSGKWLYKNVFYPVLSEAKGPIQTVVYSPDLGLKNIPLGAIHTGNGFLAEHLNTVVVPSFENYVDHKETYAKNLPGALCVNPEIPDGKLPFQEQTGKAIQSRNPASVRLLSGMECAKENIENFVRSSTGEIYLHIGAHGTFSSGNPLTSFIALSPSQSGLQAFNSGRGSQSTNSSLVDAWSGIEIAASDFSKVKLLTFSSCEIGRQGGGLHRGSFGMTQALTISGAKNVIAPIWAVQDESSSRLMKDLHSGLQEGKSISASLREAQKKMLGTKEFRHPFYWSPYVYTEIKR